MKPWNEYAKHAHAFPPRCLVDLHPIPVIDLPPGVPFVPVKADFQISCLCGESAVHILGYQVKSDAYPEEEFFSDPLAIECPHCHQIVEFFDRRQHGFDGEQDLASGFEYDDDWPPKNMERVRYATPCCGQTVVKLMPGFGYQVEDFEEAELQKTQDFFDWFSLFGCCTSCGSWQSITDVECA